LLFADLALELAHALNHCRLGLARPFLLWLPRLLVRLAGSGSSRGGGVACVLARLDLLDDRHGTLFFSFLREAARRVIFTAASVRCGESWDFLEQLARHTHKI
jgi:hypothetical protein